MSFEDFPRFAKSSNATGFRRRSRSGRISCSTSTSPARWRGQPATCPRDGHRGRAWSGRLDPGSADARRQRVVAIERDDRCLAALAEISDHYPGRLEIIAGDALKTDFGDCRRQSGQDRLQPALQYRHRSSGADIVGQVGDDLDRTVAGNRRKVRLQGVAGNDFKPSGIVVGNLGKAARQRSSRSMATTSFGAVHEQRPGQAARTRSDLDDRRLERSPAVRAILPVRLRSSRKFCPSDFFA